MFTGITRGRFEVVDVEREPVALRYVVDLGELAEGLEVGASVSVDGVCQTVVALEGPRATFQAVGETLARTTLDALVVGRRVSVERAARFGDEMGGHEVSGHVMGTAQVARVVLGDARHELVLALPADWGKYLMPKGFIAIDGSSLTLGEVALGGDPVLVSLHLVPETVRLTNLGALRAGDRVNVELDSRTVTIVQTVERVLASRSTQARDEPGT